jgi:transposase
VRQPLYMAALVAARRNDRIRAFYQHLIAQGKSKQMTALIACMRKLLIILNIMLKNQQPWEHQTKMA